MDLSSLLFINLTTAHSVETDLHDVEGKCALFHDCYVSARYGG